MNLKFSICKLLLLYLFSGITSLYSQQKALYFNLYDIESGLAQNTVQSIVQDHKGFIWIATQNGLSMFDGYEFKNWYQRSDNKNGLSSSFINQLAIDKNNRIWIATSLGVNCFDSEKNKVYVYKSLLKNKKSLSDNTINCIFIDSENYLWAGTKMGLNKSLKPVNEFDPGIQDLEFSHFYHQDSVNSISANRINCFFEDTEKNIWVGTNNGLNKYNKATGIFNSYFYNKSFSSPEEANNIKSIIQINDTVFWLATKAGLFELNPKSGRIFSFNEHSFFIKNKIEGSILSLSKSTNGNVWIGTDGNGLLYYDLIKKNFYQYKKEAGNKNKPEDNYIQSLFEDKSGTLFIGTFSHGLNTTKTKGNFFELFRYVKNDNSSLSENFITGINNRENNTVWLSTLSNGVEKFNPDTRKFTSFQLKNKIKSRNYVYFQSILPISNDELLIGTVGAGLLLLNHTKNTVKQYLFDNENILDNSIYSLLRTNDSLLWVGTSHLGLYRFNIKTKKFKLYHSGLKGFTDFKYEIDDIELGENSMLWLASWGGGLIRFNPENNTIKQFKHSDKNQNSISSDLLLSIHIDKKGIMWLGSSTGLNKFDPKTVQFTHFGKKTGFKDEYISDIIEDAHENLWISTNRGIVKFNKNNESVINFDIKDGLQHNEFGMGSCAKLADGRMIFGGVNGLNLFHPDSIKPSTFKPNVVITEFQLFYKKVEIGVKYENDFQLEKSITDVDTIVLSYKNNIIGFEFTALDFTKPDNINYAFRLKGFEENWNYTDKNDRFARYTNLTYGNYILQIKSTNGDGVWNPDIKELAVIIQAPIWQTNEFRFAIFIILILLFILFFKFRTRILIKQKKILEEQVRERTVVIESKNIELKDKYEEIVVQEEELREQAEELRLISGQLEESNKSLTQQVKLRTTELQNALIKAEDGQKLISSFLSNLSHEIRTPMNAIMGFSQLIGSMELSESKRVYYTGIIEENVQTLLTQIDNIMDVAKLHTEQYHFKNSTFSLNDLFSEIHHELATTKKIADKNISFKLHLNNKLILNSDQGVFKNIIFNLVENAIKYTEEGFVEYGFKISSLEYDKTNNFQIAANSPIELEIFVHDSGIGITEKEQKIIFDVFRKIEDKKQKLYRGSGLGLALVKNLTDKLNGSIFVNSKIDEGTRFSIKIPISKI